MINQLLRCHGGGVPRWLIVGLLLLVLCDASCALAVDSRPWTLDRYQHTAWAAKDGAPTGVMTLTQTADGFLWIGASQGLFQFDGTRFEHVDNIGATPLPQAPLSSLYPAADGSLWINYILGGTFRLKDGQLTKFGRREGFPDRAYVNHFVSDVKGGLWAVEGGSVLQFDGKHWSKAADGFAELQKAGEYINNLLFDPDGSVWIGTNSGVFYCAPHAHSFVKLQTSEPVGGLMLRSDGSVWVDFDNNGGVERWTIQAGVPTRAPGSLKIPSSARMLSDPEGNVWINTGGNGLRQIAGNAIDADPALTNLDDQVATFTTTNGLSGDYVLPSLLDREGNMWVGTNAGIDRFSRSNFTPIPLPRDGDETAIASGLNGKVWFGFGTKQAMVFDGSQLTKLDIPAKIASIYDDKKGITYMAGGSGLWEIRDGAIKKLADLPSPKPNFALSITEGLDGTLWIDVAGAKGSGIYTWKDAQWHQFSGDAVPNVLHTDAQGRIWAAFMMHPGKGQVRVIDAGKAVTLGPAQGLTIGDALAFGEDAHRLWIGGSNGLGYMDGMRMRVVRFADGQSINKITALVFEQNGDLWIHALNGIFEIAAKDVIEAESDPSHIVPTRKFDQLDGVPGSPATIYPHPTAVASTDGRLWFVTDNGVVWVDSKQLITNSLPPTVVVTGVNADQKTYEPINGLTLPPQTRDVNIGFSALGLTLPQRVQVKVRLVGLDDGWKDVGPQRQVSFTNLKPKNYRFEVIAANSDGIWNNVGAKLTFSVRPAFYQTVWFMALCVVVALIVLWLLFVWRLRQLSHRVRIKLEARHAERERIARDLHDTLLQSFPALLLKLQVGVENLSNPVEREALNKTLDQAHDIVTESRDHISRLRTQQRGDIVQLLSAFAAEHQHHFHIAINISVNGRERLLKDETLQEVCFIAREAILNACRHAKAETISVLVEYAPSELLLRIQDDGQGIDEDVLLGGAKAGHWGMLGMKERAKQISATLTFKTVPPGGAEVELRVPRRTAYATNVL